MSTTQKVLAYCANCRSLSAARLDDNQKIICLSCNENTQLSANNPQQRKTCQYCDTVIYADKAKLARLHEYCEAFESVICEKCGVAIKRENKTYRCPRCKDEYTLDYIKRELEDRRAHEAQAIQLKCNLLDMRDRMIYVHPRGNAIPPGSVLIVQDNQSAVLEAAGRYYAFETAGVHPIFFDTRSEEERMNAINALGGAPDIVPVQINTRLFFFDERAHPREGVVGERIALGATGYSVSPKFSYILAITSPTDLLTNAFEIPNDANDDSILNMLTGWADEAINDALHMWCASVIGDEYMMGMGDGAQQLASALSGALMTNSLTYKINEELSRGKRGILIGGLRVSIDGRVERTSAN